MISDEDLRLIAEDDHVYCGDASAMAKELLAYRQAFSEPHAYEVKGILCHTLEEAEIYVGDPEPLFAKPTIPS
ncbi:hypothetical protein C1N58_12655 [Pantoea sp. SGAir0180]